MVPETSSEATQMEPLLTPAILDREPAVVQRISKTQSMSLCCNSCSMVTQCLWKAVKALAFATLGFALPTTSIRMWSVRRVRFRRGWTWQRLEQMSNIWMMIAHVIPNSINGSSRCLQLNTFPSGLCNLDKQFAVSTQYLLMGDR